MSLKTNFDLVLRSFQYKKKIYLAKIVNKFFTKFRLHSFRMQIHMVPLG